MTRPPRQDLGVGSSRVTRLSFEAFESDSEAYDRSVLRSPVQDRFCASSHWILPARRAFAESARPWILRVEEGWAPLMLVDTILGRTLVPFEYGWGFASPFVGPDPGRVADVFAQQALASREEWDAMFLSGLERGGPAFVSLVHRLRRRYQMRLGQPAVRRIASLEGGWDGYLGRRAAKFRRNLRREERRAGDSVQIEVVESSSPAQSRGLFQAVLGVEAASWKGAEGIGIDDGPMRRFYARMVPRLAGSGALRVTLARREGALVGYVLGAVWDETYRGLQISFVEAERGTGLGNLMQAATIRWLCEHGQAKWYDLGGDLAYKERWAERAIETIPLLIR